MACPLARDSIAKEVEECEELVIHIPPADPPEWLECCIYRVPKQLRKLNGEAYTPKLVSIGPFHHEADELKDMEKHKQRYLKHFLKRTLKIEEDLRKIIEGNEENIYHSYSKDCGVKSGTEFVQMILLDAIFIIELFLKTEAKEDDYILSKPWLQIGILHDLILLENQLPFFILEELYMSACCVKGQQITEHKDQDLKKEDSPSFVELSRNYFGCYDKKPKSIIDEEVKVKHFTDLLRYSFLPSDIEDPQQSSKEQKSSKERSLCLQYCATKLDDAGLKFKGVEHHSRLLDISVPSCEGCINSWFCFSCFIACLPCCICLLLTQRTLKVPQLVIDDDTETIFRNLMALEQCHYPSKTYVCSYVLLLDRLVDTDKDVDLLVEKNVIDNQLGSNADVASLINKLCVQIVETPSSYFINIAKKLNRHYKFFLNPILATLKREYFPNIFRGTATVIGLIVLGFTFWNFLRPFVV
ncbi:UPF0481 protein At3g47200-like [Corylus avellana]|uniref:UPF0481 protein At3g47200-like n=1 Tax=Corylus avellana TaxID=13451 RepID=UPI001E232CEF|nr:UPF0481 protein At3g47200-like [Corylus avellana]